MIKALFFAPLLSISLSINAQSWVGITSQSPSTASVKLISSTIDQSVIKFSLDGYYSKTVTIGSNTLENISIDGSTAILETGAPDLPKLTASIIIPDKGGMSAQIISSSYTDFQNISIAPSKGNLTRDIDPSTVPYTFGASYSENAFYPGKLTELNDPYVLRDYRGEALQVYPFQYNPVTKVLRVYSEIILKVSKSSISGLNELIRTKTFSTVDHEFSKIYSSHFLNFSNSKYTPLEEHGKMLIVCYDSYMSAMQPFVDWKNDVGIPTEMVSVTAAGGTADAIKTYVANYYNTNGLTFLLLVGDVAQVPTFMVSGGGSDNSYGYILGGSSDHYQELFVGRFSAENITHVTTQVSKTINYEKTPSTLPGLFNKCMGIGSDQGPGDDGEYDYQHQRGILTDLMGSTYISQAELFDGSQGGLDAAENPVPENVSSLVNPGLGIITYTGHGANNLWATTNFSNTDAAALTNKNVQPFIWSVACVNGNFTVGTCFAEAWLRATSGGQPTGAVAVLMSTINQSWNPPMEGQDEMVDLLVESYTNNIKRSFGGLSVNGMFKMNDTYADYTMTDTWNLFGDPSLMVRTADPMSMAVSHDEAVIFGTTQLSVNCNVEGAFVCLTINNQIIGTGTVLGGSANIAFPALTTSDSILVTVTAYNYIPFQTKISVVSANGPYIIHGSHSINDASSNNNGKADFGESVLLNVSVANIGVAVANNVVGTISTTNANVTIIDNTFNYGTINAGNTALGTNGYTIAFDNTISDQEVVAFEMLNTDGTDIWNSNFSITANAPAMAIGTLTVSDPAPGGNNNGKLDPGETATITIEMKNDGHATHLATPASITSNNPNVTINADSVYLGSMASASNENGVFNITISPTCLSGTAVDLTCHLGSNAYEVAKLFSVKVGLVSEDYESGDFTNWDWTFGDNLPWVITTSSPYEGSDCAKSGTISHKQSSTMQIILSAQCDDSISFYRKLSSEKYDKLYFYVDGSIKGSWSGALDWQRYAYSVSAGSHTYKWAYTKDNSISSGDDCAYVDFIVFPPQATITSIINEGTDFNFNAYPNPASENIRIDLDFAEQSDIYIAFYDMNGKVVQGNQVYSVNSGKQSFSVGTNQLTSGIYTLCVRTEKGTVSRRIIIRN